MKIISLMLVFLLYVSAPFTSLRDAHDGDLPALLRSVFTKVKENSVYRTRVDWTDLEQQVFSFKENELTESEFKEKVVLIFTKIGDRHGALFYNGERLGMDRSWLKKLRIPENQPKPVQLSTQRLEPGYGYILLPPDKRHDPKTLQLYQDSLCKLGIESLKGLVIDLRLHEGGSVNPLFAGLNQVYGTSIFGSNTDLNGKVFQKWTVKNGNYGHNAINNRCQPNKQLKVVVLISEITASAGEMMAVALKGRPKTLFIGEPTAGLTTMNITFAMGKHTLAIAASVITDRNGNAYRDNVLPDVSMVGGDNFLSLNQDEKVAAALKWMKQ